jgi:ABC-type dipeptide/oligopeptide/nickel transport system permease component
MHKMILWRIAQFPLILAIIYFLTFLLAWVAPGSPFQNEKNLDPTVVKTLQTKFHANSAMQFLEFYPWQVIRHFDFGPSMQYREFSVNDVIDQALPVSVTLGLCALFIAVMVGVGVGTLSAVRRGGITDWSSLSITLIGISLPSFVTAALMLMIAASVKLPIGGWGNPSNLVLPSIALSLGPMAYITRLTRVSMLDVLGTDYVRTGRAKGLSRSVVIWKHCLRNAFLPVLSFLGPAAASTLTGSFVVEKVFNIPGLGQHFVNSVQNRDRTLLLGVVMVESAFLLIFNLLVDVAYAFVDPRIDVT